RCSGSSSASRSPGASGRPWKAPPRSSDRDDKAARRFSSPGNGAPFSFLGRRAMPQRLSYGIVRDAPRRVIHVVRVQDEILETPQIVELAERMRERLALRGETLADVVVIQGDSKETLRLFGEGYSVGRVRAALFNAALSWSPLQLD